MKTKYTLKNGQSLFTYCKEHGLRYDTIVLRIKTHKITPDIAIKNPIRVRKTNVEKTLRKIAKQDGIDFDKLMKVYNKLLKPSFFRWVRL